MSSAEIPSATTSGVRYHGMDALRAWAMSMGIVLHAAWFMIPRDFGAPQVDASATRFAEYGFLAIHLFRMQLFFVLAGLFACLLLRKRGLSSFTRNRVKRIVVPLIVFLIILVPIMMWQRFAAGKQTGALLMDYSALELTLGYVLSIRLGNILLQHLWFLYYLCWAYVVLFAARGLAVILDPRAVVRNQISDGFGWIVAKPWSVLVLAGVFAALMVPMRSSVGIEVEYFSLYSWRKLYGLLSYILYFTAGWLIYRNIDKLGLMIRSWRWQLGLGLLLTVPYFYYFEFAIENGYSTHRYPELSIQDFHHHRGAPDYSDFRERLLDSEPGSVPAELWALLPEENQDFIRLRQTATENQLGGLLFTINKGLLTKPELACRVDLAGIELPDQAMVILETDPAVRTIDQNRSLNRYLIEQGFSGVIYSENVYRPYYYPIRVACSYVYSLTTWLLIFGCIGFSQHHFDRESKFWRYFSDSSYWFYLAHLPIQYQLLLWVGDLPWNPLVKFSFYVIATVAVLLPSYHFLVRPTWIGLMLNGRMTSVWKKAPSANANDNANDNAKTSSPQQDQSPDLRIDVEHPAKSKPEPAEEAEGRKDETSLTSKSITVDNSTR